MHKLIDYICNEIDDLKHKVEQGGKLNINELQYLDTLAHTKKNLLTGDAMMESGYSNDYSYRRGRDAMGRYVSRDDGGSYRYSRSEAKDRLMNRLKDMSRDMQDDESKEMLHNMIRHAETNY